MIRHDWKQVIEPCLFGKIGARGVMYISVSVDVQQEDVIDRRATVGTDCR